MDKLRVMVCVTGQVTCERLIREGARRAKELEAELSVVHVARPGAGVLGVPSEGEALEYLLRAATAYGAEMTVIHSDDAYRALVRRAREIRADLIVLGASDRSQRDFARWMESDLPSVSVHTVYAGDA